MTTMKFKLLGGTHSEPKLDSKLPLGKEFVTYRKGAIIESDRDLVADFPNKFERVRRGDPDAPDVDPNGEDVTEFFRTAEGTDYQVFKSGHSYIIIDKTNPGTPVNKKPLTSKGEVVAYLKKKVAA